MCASLSASRSPPAAIPAERTGVPGRGRAVARGCEAPNGYTQEEAAGRPVARAWCGVTLPPLTDALSPPATLLSPPLTHEPVPLATFCSPPLTEA
jgi:hypothetical protein